MKVKGENDKNSMLCLQDGKRIESQGKQSKKEKKY